MIKVSSIPGTWSVVHAPFSVPRVGRHHHQCPQCEFDGHSSRNSSRWIDIEWLEILQQGDFRFLIMDSRWSNFLTFFHELLLQNGIDLADKNFRLVNCMRAWNYPRNYRTREQVHSSCVTQSQCVSSNARWKSQEQSTFPTHQRAGSVLVFSQCVSDFAGTVSTLAQYDIWA